MKEILIYGEIVSEDVSEWWPDAVSPKQIYDALQEAGGEDVLLRFNSPGGSASAGVAICNLLKDYTGDSIGRVDGIAASAASVVLMGCNTAEMASNSALMIHAASYFLYGQLNANDLRQYATQLDNFDQRLAGTYAKKSGDKTADDFLEMMAVDTYLTADEAKELGLIDSITDESEAEIHIRQAVASTVNMEGMPSEVAARVVIDAPKAKKGKMQDHVEKTRKVPQISTRTALTASRFGL